MDIARIGLCDNCLHHAIVKNQRGSIFHLCERSKKEKAFPKYPKLPVIECKGFEQTANFSKEKSNKKSE